MFCIYLDLRKALEEGFSPPFYTTSKLTAFGCLFWLHSSPGQNLCYCKKRGKCLKFITSSTSSSLSAVMDAFVLSISRISVSVSSCLPQCLRQEKHPIKQKSGLEQTCLDEIETTHSRFWGCTFSFIASLGYTSVPSLISSVQFHI